MIEGKFIYNQFCIVGSLAHHPPKRGFFIAQKNMKKEIIDQSAHFLAGLAATLLIAIWINVLLAGMIVAVFAVGREIWQRVSQGKPWYQCWYGCRLDLLFWALGIMSAVIINIFK